ncbi:hypothetical protein [Planktotalea sp.]|uniref:hypothetical protein n=1 Tax=Planktotalea sp. TaxID=2029877 RepID=UPI003D6AA4E0
MLKRIFFILVTVWGSQLSAGDSKFRVYELFLNLPIYEDYKRSLAGKDIADIDIADLPKIARTRHIAEILIHQIAPVLGGCNCRIMYSPYASDTSHARSLEQIRLSQQVSHGVASFLTDSRANADGILLSEPILAADEFFVGLYTHEARSDILELDDPDELKQLRFGVSRNWEIDRKVLADRNLIEVTADGWNNLMVMVANKRADVIMQPFTAEEDFSFTDSGQGLKLLPIPNYKMLFGDGRSYTISSTHPNGEEFLTALNKGIRLLRENGTIHEFMVNSGVINERVEDFVELKFD